MFEFFQDKTAQYWVILASLGAYAFTHNKEGTRLNRFVKSLISAGLAIGASEDLAERLGWSDIIAASAIMLFGQVILDTVFDIAGSKAYREKIGKAWLAKKLGVEINDDEQSDK